MASMKSRFRPAHLAKLHSLAEPLSQWILFFIASLAVGLHLVD
jgi:hypothetical protein